MLMHIWCPLGYPLKLMVHDIFGRLAGIASLVLCMVKIILTTSSIILDYGSSIVINLEERALHVGAGVSKGVTDTRGANNGAGRLFANNLYTGQIICR